MSIFMLGSTEMAMTAGMTNCAEAGGQAMPFIAFAPTDSLPEVWKTDGDCIKDSDDVDAVVKAFGEKGTVVFFGDVATSRGFMRFMSELLMHALNTDWEDFRLKRETIQ